MASHLSVSLSDSIQASLIIQHQEQRRQRHSTNPTGRQTAQDDTGDGDEDPTEELSMWVQCLLVMVFASMEMSATFTFIYMLLFLEFVGVPTSLMSVGGVIGGGATMLFLPVLGWFSDRGPNPMTHRVRMMLVCFSAYVSGYIILALVSASKLYSFKIVGHENTTAGSEGVVNFRCAHNLTIGIEVTLLSQPTYFQSNHSCDSTSMVSINNETYTSYTDINTTPDIIGYISIFSFVLLDIGYDSSMCLCRAFVLQCSPQTLHTKLLVLSTVFGSVAGAIFSLVGTINFPEILGPMFQVDGTAATILLFSCFILTFTTLCFACTLIIGYRLVRKNSENDRNIGRVDFESQSNIRRPIRPKMPTENLHRDDSTHSLLANNFLDNNSYNTFSTSSEDSIEKSCVIGLDKTNLSLCQSYESNTRNVNKPETEMSNANEVLMSLSTSRNESENNDRDEENVSVDSKREKGFFTVIATITSYSMSMSIFKNSLLEENTEIQCNQSLTDGKPSDKPNTMWKNKRLMILIVSLFFTMGTTVLISVYSSNTLTIGVYHALPTAQPGSEGRELYDKGLSSASLGFFILYFSYMVFSLLNKKMIDVVGEKVLFLACHTLIIALLVVYMLIKTEELFYASSVAAGAFRACAFTIGFILAHKFVAEEHAKTGGAVSNIGQVMMLLGFLVPGQYMLMSIFMGPLINATGNVWVTMIYGTVCASLSVVVFSLLFIVKC